MEVKSEYYRSWEEYRIDFPEVAEIENAEKVQNYEEEIYTFIMQLFL